MQITQFKLFKRAKCQEYAQLHICPRRKENPIYYDDDISIIMKCMSVCLHVCHVFAFFCPPPSPPFGWENYFGRWEIILAGGKIILAGGKIINNGMIFFF